MTQTLSLFVDTNLLLQCRAPAELKWNEVTDASRVELLISRPVQTEIDRLKGDGNGRRARRARAFSSTLRDLVQAESHEVIARPGSPTVVWKLPPRLDPQREVLPTLDMAYLNDQLVEAALAYRAAHPDADVRLLSHDTGPQLSAHEHDLVSITVPADWLLEPEPDATTKALNELRRRVDQLEGEKPILELTCGDWTTKAGPLSTRWLDFSPPSPAQVEQWAMSIERANPLILPEPLTSVKRSMADLGISVLRPSEDQIRNYQQEWETWRKKLRVVIPELATYLMEADDSSVLHIDLSNSGAAPAANVIMEIEAVGFLLDAPARVDILTGKTEAPQFGIPRAPKPPKSLWEGYDDLLGRRAFNFEPPPTPAPHSRHRFYWRPNRPQSPTNYWRRESDEFRHQLGAQRFSVRLRPMGGSVRGSLKVRVSAANLVSPVILQVPIQMERVQMSFESAVEILKTRLQTSSPR